MPDKDSAVWAGKDPVRLLLERIPEYRAQVEDRFLDLPYIVFGFFAQYLVESVNDSGVIRRVFELLNELCDSGEPELQNLAQVGVFETIAGDSRWAALAERYLGREGLKLFHDIQSSNKR